MLFLILGCRQSLFPLVTMIAMLLSMHFVSLQEQKHGASSSDEEACDNLSIGSFFEMMMEQQLQFIKNMLKNKLDAQQCTLRDRNNAAVRIARWVEQNYLRRKKQCVKIINEETHIMQAMMEKQTMQVAAATKIATWIELHHYCSRINLNHDEDEDTSAINALQEDFELEFKALKEDFATRFEGPKNGALAMEQTKMEENNVTIPQYHYTIRVPKQGCRNFVQQSRYDFGRS